MSPEAVEPDLQYFTHGSVTLARVVKVTNLRATLTLHPLASDFILRKRDIFAEDSSADEMLVSDVVRVGQTVRVNVDRSSDELKISLIDIDEQAPLIEPLPLLRGGQPWLQEGVDALVEDETVEQHETQQVDLVVDAESSYAQEHLTVLPAINETTGAIPSEPSEQSLQMQAIHDEMLELRGAFVRFSREMRAGTPFETLDQLRDELTRTQAELHREREARAELRLMVSRLNQELREARATAQTPVTTKGGAVSDRGRWHDDELWLRHEVQHAWVERTDASDKGVYPIQQYKVGADFVQSLTQLEDKTFAKAMRAIVDVVTGRVADIHARELHQLRTGMGGDDPYVQRSDGAWCWRVSLESKTPQARRLHFWRLPEGGVELSRVVLHDDFQP